jgi:cytochrome c oxidase subunit 2
MKHIVNVVVLIAVVTVVVAVGLNSLNLLPPLASEEGAYVDRLFGMHLQVIAFLFALIIVFMLYSLVAFRRKPGEEGDGAHIHGNTTLEIVWTLVPLGIVLYFSALGTQYLREITASSPDEMVVEVTASQFSWRFAYPEFGISSTELNLPRGRQVLFRITSLDVIHSFWVPEFRIKQDAVPGQIKPLRVTPTKVDQYIVRCAEMCGSQHFSMLATVNVMEPVDFEAWVAEQTAPAVELTPVERGAKAYELQGCQACHSVDGSQGVGPTWLGIFGSEEALADGTTVTVDEAYVRDSIIKPNDQIVAGFAPNLMPPTYGDVLTAEEIDDLIVFIKSLSN